jgi:hypothetical protein
LQSVEEDEEQIARQEQQQHEHEPQEEEGDEEEERRGRRVELARPRIPESTGLGMSMHHLPLEDDDEPHPLPSPPNSVIERLTKLSSQLESAVELVAGAARCCAEYHLCFGVGGDVSGDSRKDFAGAGAGPVFVTDSIHRANSLGGLRYARTRTFIHARTFIPFPAFHLASLLPPAAPLAHADALVCWQVQL